MTGEAFSFPSSPETPCDSVMACLVSSLLHVKKETETWTILWLWVAGCVSHLVSLFLCLSPWNGDTEVPLESEITPKGKDLGVPPYSVNSSTSSLPALLLLMAVLFLIFSVNK